LRQEITTQTTGYSVVSGTVDDDDEAYIVVSERKGGKCRIGKKGKKAKKARKAKQCKQGEILLQSTSATGGELTEAANCETLVQIFDSQSVTRFTDVSTTYWASTYIYQLVSLNIIQGFPGGGFLPETSLTRSHFAAIVSRAFNVSTVREIVAIRNVSSNYWAYSDIQRAYTMGFIDGIADGFDPDVPMTKLEVLVAIAQGLNYTSVSSGSSVETLLSQFTDANTIPAEYRPYIAALVEQGVILNYPNANLLNLNAVITRAETCGLIYQALGSLGVL
jgi:hypothetical protein